MAEEVVHKLYPVGTVKPRKLTSLILCWGHGDAKPESDIKVSRSINHVTCPKCWSLWMAGVYQ